MKKPEQLSAGQIDRLAGDYKNYESAIKAAKLKQESIREQLLLQVEHYGAAAPKADKTFRLESESYIVDVTQSESLVVNDEAVLELKGKLANEGLSSIAKRLFDAKTYFVKKNGAEAVAQSCSLTVQRLFRTCFDVKPASPKLSVKAKEAK